MSNEPKFWAADLGAYNAGILHGRWIPVSSDIDEMAGEVARMLRESPCPNVKVKCPHCEGEGECTFHNSETGETRTGECPVCLGAGEVDSGEEWQIHDWDDESGFFSDLGETSDLGRIAEMAEAFEEIESDYDDSIIPILLKWAAEKVCEPYNYKSAIEDGFAGVWNDPEDYAADLCESCGDLGETPEFISRYIDFKAMARDMALGGEMDFICISTGEYLQDYDSMRGRECVALRNI